MPRVTIYVPDDLKAEMDDIGDRVNWSSAAQTKFAEEIRRVREAGAPNAADLVGLIRTAVLKACTDRGVPESYAREFLEARLQLAIAHAARSKPGITADFESNPVPWLEGSEFDTIAQPYWAHPQDAKAFWVFNLRNAGQAIARSLHDEFLTDVHWAPERNKFIAEARKVSGGPAPTPECPKRTLEHRVVEAVSEGDIVIEIRGPIRSALAFYMGRTFFPGHSGVQPRGQEAEHA